MTDAITMPRGGAEVLGHLMEGRSAWHGWEAGHPARSQESHDAYAERARTITALRKAGLLNDDSQVTPAGRELWERAHG